MRGRFTYLPAVLVAALPATSTHVSIAQIDDDGNGQSDVWQLVYGSGTLPQSGDADGDGMTNGAEALAGTDPLDPGSVLAVNIESSGDGIRLWCPAENPKRYDILFRPDFTSESWETLASVVTAEPFVFDDAAGSGSAAGFYQIAVSDEDTDGDGLTDWDEWAIGLDMTTGFTDRRATSDFDWVRQALSLPSTVTVHTVDGVIHENWPDPGIVAIRRAGGLEPLTIALSLSGSATSGADYQPPDTIVSLPAGETEVWVSLAPLTDAEQESAETITVNLLPGSGYQIGNEVSADIVLNDDTGTPSEKEVARFLLQASFGPTDALIAEVQASGIEAWIDNQFVEPMGYHQPYGDLVAAGLDPEEMLAHEVKTVSWWNEVMTSNDQLRQRVAFALSEIFVISDEADALFDRTLGMLNYYDMLLDHSFGNFRDLLMNVTLHPCMGLYLSHLMNIKSIPEENVFPDENYAREVMQLFSIGLWELNPDGTQVLVDGAPVPTYDNGDITNFARVFTGLSFGGSDVTDWEQFFHGSNDATIPMEMWEVFHDTDAKDLLRGTSLSPGQTGMADLNATIDNLFQHPNVAPFITQRLIQRMVTSNPTPEYIARVSGVFDDNEQGVRGDMRAVIRAILLDPEARDPSFMDDSTHGMLREPYVRLVNLARAFNATSPGGLYNLFYLGDGLGQEPYRSPTVFNFFLPTYAPPGPISQANLVAPEFQITNAVTAITTPNYFLRAIAFQLNLWNPDDADERVRLDLAELIGMADDPDALIGRLDGILTYGNLSAVSHRAVRQAIERLPESEAAERAVMALSLITYSPEFAILK